MTTPRTALSQLYHSTIPAYRDEMHLDMEDGHRRFGIAESDKDWRDAVAEVDVAAFKVRDAAKANKTGPKDELSKASEKLFGLLDPILAAEIRGGAAGDLLDKPAPERSLLEKLYFLFYSLPYRADDSSSASNALPGASSDVQQSWDAVRAALRAGGGPVSTTKLCEALDKEFNDGLWVIVW
ncbi:MAG TPA: hypothetical protein VM686_35265 [Polyangiaceae bacterium]|nr:hypothetical protein [Polyangiaceae bacterium]